VAPAPSAPAGRRTAVTRFAGEFLLFAVVGALLVAGGVLWLLGTPGADPLWTAATLAAVLPAAAWVAADLRAGRFGADLLAVLALVGTVVVGEHLAGAVVAVMLGGGRALDAYAQRKAGRDLSALLDHAPRTARLRTSDGLRPVPVQDVLPGDVLVLGQGEVAAVDGTLLGPAVLDESALTGEAAPVPRPAGDRVRSGVVNTGSSVDLRAVATERDSTYAGVIALAREAAAAGSPAVRMADRVAAWFLPVALVVAGLAAFLAGDLDRAVAVLVTATPCPLLLAVPVAITAGMSRASRVGVVVRDGRSLEVLGDVRTAVLDKTGTVTAGRPAVTEVLTAPGWSTDAVLDLAAAVEQVSSHVFAPCVVSAAAAAGRRPDPATGVVEAGGTATSGFVEGHEVAVGARDPDRLAVPPWVRDAEDRARQAGAGTVWVSRDGDPVGVLLVRDTVRPDAARTLGRLRAAGLTRLVLLTGDRWAVARDVAAHLGFDEVVAECDPADKVGKVRSEKAAAMTAMVGDGFNDAPALAAADVGVAVGGRGSAAAVRAADVVILDDRIDGLADAVDIAGRARRIARQSAVAGMGLSLVAMAFAAVGLLPPALGAVVQEAIDVAVILNALRVVLPARRDFRPARADLGHCDPAPAWSRLGSEIPSPEAEMREPSVNQVMTRDVVTARTTTPFKDVVELLDSGGFSAVPVVDERNRPVGVVSEADLLAKEEFAGGTAPSPSLFANRDRKERWRKSGAATAGDAMTAPVITIAPDAPVSAAARQLARTGVRRLFVIDADGALAGVVARRDLLSLFLRDDEDLRDDVLQQVFHRVFLVDPATFDVRVEGGVVTVGGKLERRSDAELAARLIHALPGVVDVASALTYGWDDTNVKVPSDLKPRP